MGYLNYLNTLGSAVGDPLYNLGLQLFGILPDVIIMTVVVVFGYLLGSLLGSILRHTILKLKIGEKFKKLQLAKPLGKIRISSVAGEVVKWYTFVVFTAAGANYVKLDPVTSLLLRFAEWFPNLILALGIGLVGVMLAEYLYHLITHVQIAEAKLIGNIIRWVIIVIALLAALAQVNLQIHMLENMVLLLVAGISLGLALALGISFGLALKDDAKGWVKSFKK